MTAALLVIAMMLARWPGGQCPPDYFCAPPVGIYGQIVPYSDASGQAPLGDGIRSLDYIPGLYLVGHSYTQFWAVVMLKPGDVVYANGLGYRIRGRFIQYACQPPAMAPAPLSLQTSLDSAPCGLVLVVQGDRE